MNKTFELSVADLEEIKRMNDCVRNQRLIAQMMELSFKDFILTILKKYGVDETKKYNIDTINGIIVEIEEPSVSNPENEKNIKKELGKKSEKD